jgi:DNA-binding PadR family transcriptional regulator
MDIDIKRRTNRAFADLTLLCILTRQNMTSYQIYNLIVKNFGFIIDARTVYSKLRLMEKRELITVVGSAHGKRYGLSEKGKEITENIDILIKDINNSTKALLKFCANRQKAIQPQS